VVSRGQRVGRYVGARAGIREELRRGRRSVDMLNSIVTVAFEDRTKCSRSGRDGRVHTVPADHGRVGETWWMGKCYRVIASRIPR